MTQELQQYVNWLIESGNAQILQRNSRSLTPKWKRLLQGGLEPVLSAAPFVAIFAIGYFATHAVFLAIEWVML